MMTRWLTILLCCAAWTGSSATYWNAWTTNAPGTVVRGNGDLAITNLSGGLAFRFYGSGADTVARLGDITGGSGSGLTNAMAGNDGIAVGIVGGTLWITNLWSTNGFVDQNITNGLAAITFVEGLTNGFVDASVTNGLATVAYVNTATNGFVSQSVTNGLATVVYVNSATNGFVTATITNGLATVAYVQTATNGFVGIGITNGLAAISYVNTATGNLATVVQPASDNLTNWSNMATSGLSVYYLASNPSGYISGIGTTNQPASINLTNWSGTATSALASYYLASNPSSYVTAAVTNGLAALSIVQPASANLTNWSGMATSALSSYYLASNPSSYVTAAITNGLLGTAALGTIGYSNAAIYLQRTNDTVRGLTVGNATASRAALYDANGVLTNGAVTVTELGLLAGQTTLAYQPTNATLTQWGTVATNAYVSATNGSARGLTVANATASKAAAFDANSVLTNAAPTVTELNLLSGQTTLAYQPTNNNTVTAVTATGTEIASISAGTLTVNGGMEYSGCSGNFSIAATTIWWPLDNTKTNFNASDVSGGTRNVIARGGTLTNLYVVMAGTVGNNNSNHFQIFTNGVATAMAVLITGTSATTGNDTTHATPVLAGMEVGIKIISSASATARAVNWALEKR